MKHAFSYFLVAFATLAWAGEESGRPLVRVGDSVYAVRNHLGEPKIEFPLNGQFIQDYGHCIITSKGGVVVAIQDKEGAAAKQKSVSKDDLERKTAKILLAKAEKGDLDAQYRLAYCYQMGAGVARNSDECVRWYTIAAMKGHAPSQHNLGVLYLTGNGVERDYEQAYTWGVLAAENGNDTLILELMSRLTAEQELAGRLRAWRIRDGLEPLPYGSPDDSTAIAKKDALSTPAAVVE